MTAISVKAHAIVGPPRSGKTSALATRVAQSLQRGGTALVLAPSAAALRAIERACDGVAGATFATIGAFAADLLRAGTTRLAGARIVDDVDAELLFERTAEPLLAMQWPELVAEVIDPEVPGLRSPQRFLQAAFALVRKLRDAQIAPEEFLRSARVGATSFYAKPPNFATPDLLLYTKETYRDSLAVTPDELARQFRHETHLMQILANLYRDYLATQAAQGVITERDAVAEATAALRASDSALHAFRSRFDAVFVDDAQELTLGELALLQTLFGEELASVTLAGDPHGATGAFRGARPDRVFPATIERTALDASFRPAAPLRATVERIRSASRGDVPAPSSDVLLLHRAADRAAEARFIADDVADRIRAGTPPGDIALILRSVSGAEVYENALLALGVPVHTVGDVNVFRDRRALDALALLWNVHDPFAHEWLLRTLAAPALALNDASIAALCAEPPDGQTQLFAPEDLAGEDRAKRWDPNRDLRLGWNVLRGSCDAQLSEIARERLVRFRALRSRWVEAAARMPLLHLARMVWSEGLARAGGPGSATARTQQLALQRLLRRVERFADDEPSAGLGAFLAYAAVRAESDFETCEDGGSADAVYVASIDAVRGRDFSHVVIPGAHAGSFPRWYVPDSFMYSPSLGMIAKENVGDATASRTAKFTYYMYRTKSRERYNAEERKAFAYALSRARDTATVTAYGRPTRGASAPEFLEELRAWQR